MKNRSFADRARDAVLAILALSAIVQVAPHVFAAWDQTKPANNSALVSSEIRANWASLQAALGNPDSVPLSPAVAFQFIGAPAFKPGTSAAYDGTTSGRVSTNTTVVGNVGAGTDPLMSDVIKADWLSSNGKVYRYTGYGTGVNNANAKQILATLDGTSVFTSGAFTTEWQLGWTLNITVAREDATHAKVSAILSFSGANMRHIYTRVTVANWTANRTLQVNCVGVADNDVVQEVGVGEVVG